MINVKNYYIWLWEVWYHSVRVEEVVELEEVWNKEVVLGWSFLWEHWGLFTFSAPSSSPSSAPSFFTKSPIHILFSQIYLLYIKNQENEKMIIFCFHLCAFESTGVHFDCVVEKIHDFRLTIVWVKQVYDSRPTIVWAIYDFLADHSKIIYEILHD